MLSPQFLKYKTMIPARIDLWAWDAINLRLYTVEAVISDTTGIYGAVRCAGEIYPLHNFSYFYFNAN